MNMNEVLKQREQISALADGQLHGDDFAATVEAVAMADDARESWHVYHLVGDVMRSADLGTRGGDLAFVARLRQRLQEEAATQPKPQLQWSAPAVLGVESHGMPDPAANEPVLRWKLVAGFASLAAVAAIGWQLLGVGGATPAASQLAQTAPVRTRVAAADDGAAMMIRDARLDDLLAAHRQLGAASALQNPSGFLRNATFVEGRVD